GAPHRDGGTAGEFPLARLGRASEEGGFVRARHAGARRRRFAPNRRNGHRHHRLPVAAGGVVLSRSALRRRWLAHRPCEACRVVRHGAPAPELRRHRLQAVTAEEIIRTLGLEPHPEGGHFRETWRDGDGTSRGAGTAIYFLLQEGERSHWHRVDAAEIWHFHA